MLHAAAAPAQDEAPEPAAHPAPTAPPEPTADPVAESPLLARITDEPIALRTAPAGWVRDDDPTSALDEPDLWWSHVYGGSREAPPISLEPLPGADEHAEGAAPGTDATPARSPEGVRPLDLRASFSRTERPAATLSASVLPDTGIADDQSLSALASQRLVRWDVSQSTYISGLGQRRRPDPDTLAFVLSAEAGVELSPRAGLAIGYELFRATDAGERTFADTLDEGLFAQFRLRF